MDFKYITNFYNKLVNLTKQHLFIGITNEWIVDNYYMLVEKNDSIKNFKKNKKQRKYLTDKLILMLVTILENRNYKIDENILISDIKSYCEENNIKLIYQELEIIPVILNIILMKKIKEICVIEKNKIKERKKVDKLIKNFNKDCLNDIINYSPYTIVYFSEQIKKISKNSNNIFKLFNKILEKNNLSLRKLINEEHLNNTNLNILINNIFYSIKKVDLIEIENLFNNLCEIEDILKKDPYYHLMTKETKFLYRKQLFKIARKNKQDVFSCASKLIDEDKNIGNVLFKRKNNNFKTIIYLLIILSLSIILTLILSNYFISNKILGFIVLFIPVSEFVITFVNKIYLKIYPSRPIFKLDFKDGIPKNYKTMVVIPTILKNKEKVDEMFDTLEKYYLSNKSKNIYFTLLGDACECKTENYEKDDEIANEGLLKVLELNKKYKNEIFYFAYRNRKYNKYENSYLGFERKRGALLHFNDLLLNNFNDKEKKEWFKVQTFDNFKHKIKYVITLDSDTQLVLNSALKLVGTMAHPLNKPILNDSKTKVIKGYGILQPKISVDIESTNKSLFSQIYAGIGGLDPYSTITPNFYQDVFKEGNFIGKGIYDLEIFQKVLKGRFPNNLILSHDLLEGNYLKCGFVSDVELIDDFPSKYLVDATRRSRWTRGDMQIIKWILPYVKDEFNRRYKNPISLLGKFKIIDNIRRELLDLSLLIILFLLSSIVITHPYWWLGFILFVVVLPVISYLLQVFIAQKKYSKNLKYYNIMAFGYQAFILRTLSVFTSIPYNAYLYTKSLLTATYRMFISKKHLLQWLTAEDAAKQVKGNLYNHLKQYTINYIAALSFVVLALINNSHPYECMVIAIFFLIAPFLAFAISEDIKKSIKKLNEKEKDELLEIANLTWKFFKDNLNKENNYLIPDNYQLNREKKLDYKTSPTNIGLSLVSIVSAYKLNFINKEETINYIINIIDTIDKLDKWHGHLFNWYNINTLNVLYPNFVSTVDSGNFVASLITVKEFLKELNEVQLTKRIEKIINNTDFKYLYSNEDVFSIGYNVDEGNLLPYNYNKFASESRITSFVAIAKGDILSNHWFNLDKTLTTFKKKKGLVSWSGTSFEYFMPLIFIPTYENTLVDESYDFAFYAQKEYMKEINRKYPWGISESAYNELDDSQNYKYKAFATPYLKLQEEANSRIVISPYSSLLALTRFPDEVMHNIKKLNKLDLKGEYGYYESYDAEDKKIVYSYFAHHQGMILASITNALKENIIQKYFIKDINNQAFEILNKEKVQLKPIIDVNITKYKKYTYEKETFINDVRVFHNLATLPEVSVLSNSKYSTFINDRGNGFSRYRTIQLNRYRKITEQDYGIFMYVKDLNNNKIWSNTYAPINIMPDKYEVVFALDRIKFVRMDEDIITTTEIVVPKTYHSEIRKITFKNNSDEDKVLELTSYTEPILSENIDDISHKTFQNLFVQSEYDADTNSVIMYRKLRDSDNHYYFINKLLTDDVENSSFETNRENFIGRNHNSSDPIALNKTLSNQDGTCVDPIVSLRNKITVKANDEKTVYLIIGFGKSKEQVLDIVNTFSNEENILEKGFEVATLMSNVTNKMVNITGRDMRVFNTLLNYLYQTSHIAITKERIKTLAINKLNQTNLWKFGISGDRPIVYLSINSLDDLSLTKELLHLFEYYKSKSIFIDLIILNNCEDKEIITKEIDDEKYHMYALNSFNKTPGNIYLIDNNDVNEDEINLFKTVARIYIDSNKFHSLEDFVNDLQKSNTISRKDVIKNVDSLPISYDNLTFYNGYGGFSKNGKKYIITNPDTPLIWNNVITNPTFGTIISNNQTGFTYYKNSREYKLTSWTNDPLLLDMSEGIKINDVNLKYHITEVSFGKNVYLGKYKDYDLKLTQFVSVTDPIKFYKLKIKNNNPHKQRIVLKYWINPCLGVTEEKTSRYILSEIKDNYVTLKNKYSEHFSNLITFMSCTNKISDYNVKRILNKEIETSLYIDSKEEVELSFILGCCDEENITNLLNKYDIKTINKEEKNVENYWQNMLENIQVKTPDDSFNYMVNGWLAYQNISSRLYAKAGFYQVGGAFGYRDQLQDAMNLCTIHPEMTKEIILWNAKHQFKEGDVLHWWHKETNIGLRSRYKDDYLWLVYAVCEYIEITEDYDILNTQIPFVTGPSLLDNEMEKGINYSYTEETATLYDHCLFAINKTLNELGSNGLPLMGGGDWNDGMNKVGEKGIGTSVWLGFFLYIILNRFSEFSKIDYTNEINKLKTSLLNIWDGEYYLRAYFDNGTKLGSNECLECKIDLLSQSFAILSGIASEEQIKSMLKNVEEKLVDKNINIVKLLTPPFKNNKNNPGYIMNYPKGIRENGGQYTHAVAWYIEALIKAGNNDLAYQIFQMINPIERTKTKEDTDKYKLEPYVISADIYSNENFLGRGGWNWYTGSAGWFYHVALIDILGFNLRKNKLYIKPNIPSTWKQYEITYKYFDTKYNITVINSKENKIIFDDKTVKYIPLKNDMLEHNIKVYGGNNAKN